VEHFRKDSKSIDSRDLNPLSELKPFLLPLPIPSVSPELPSKNEEAAGSVVLPWIALASLLGILSLSGLVRILIVWEEHSNGETSFWLNLCSWKWP
jgi:hypothetical protein